MQDVILQDDPTAVSFMRREQDSMRMASNRSRPEAVGTQPRILQLVGLATGSFLGMDLGTCSNAEALDEAGSW
eukprot:6464027-Amphidinium_carterae.1